LCRTLCDKRKFSLHIAGGKRYQRTSYEIWPTVFQSAFESLLASTHSSNDVCAATITNVTLVEQRQLPQEPIRTSRRLQDSNSSDSFSVTPTIMTTILVTLLVRGQENKSQPMLPLFQGDAFLEILTQTLPDYFSTLNKNQTMS
jgi:hypothetical protein